jgi:rhodanese-related sulfurtransferase
MSPINTISIDKLARLIGTPKCPVLIDVQTEDDFAADPRLIPGAIRRPWSQASEWAKEFTGQSAIVICPKGLKLSQGVAAWLRHEGIPADSLEGGALAWAQAGLPMVPEAVLPPRDPQGRTVWVTRARPKVDRIACPWLIRRFVDPKAVFLFVAASEVPAVAQRFGAASLRHRRRGRVLEPSRREMHLRHHGRGVRPHNGAAPASGPDRPRR